MIQIQKFASGVAANDGELLNHHTSSAPGEGRAVGATLLSGPLTLALSPGGEGMKGRPASFCRQFGRSDVVFAGQSVVFPKVVCYIGEGQRHNSFRNFRKAAIC